MVDQQRWLRDCDLILEPMAMGPHPVHHVPTHLFRMVHGVSGEEMGRINLRVPPEDQRSAVHVLLYAGHIGYGVEPEHRGRGYASRALQLLLPLARELGLEELWITCDPENIASRRSCERAGGRLVEIVDVPEHCVIYQSGHTRKCRYHLPLYGGPAVPAAYTEAL